MSSLVEHTSITDNAEDINLQLSLPYKGKIGENICKRLKKSVTNTLPNNVNLKITYNAQKLSSRFQMKDVTKLHHQHDIVYKVVCPDESCQAEYIGETGRRLQERVMDHAGRDKNSHVAQHSINTKHTPPSYEDFSIIGRGYKGNSYKRKLSEALYIKQLRPILNVQDKSIPLKLLN